MLYKHYKYGRCEFGLVVNPIDSSQTNDYNAFDKFNIQDIIEYMVWEMPNDNNACLSSPGPRSIGEERDEYVKNGRVTDFSKVSGKTFREISHQFEPYYMANAKYVVFVMYDFSSAFAARHVHYVCVIDVSDLWNETILDGVSKHLRREYNDLSPDNQKRVDVFFQKYKSLEKGIQKVK